MCGQEKKIEKLGNKDGCFKSNLIKILESPLCISIN